MNQRLAITSLCLVGTLTALRALPDAPATESLAPLKPAQVELPAPAPELELRAVPSARVQPNSEGVPQGTVELSIQEEEVATPMELHDPVRKRLRALGVETSASIKAFADLMTLRKIDAALLTEDQLRSFHERFVLLETRRFTEAGSTAMEGDPEGEPDQPARVADHLDRVNARYDQLERLLAAEFGGLRD